VVNSKLPRAAALGAALPLALTLIGCGPNIIGTWSITLWEVEGGSADVIDDVGWIDIQDDFTGAFPLLLRYQWQQPGGLVPYPTPQVAPVSVTIGDEEELSFRSVWLFEQEVTFTAVQTRDTTMIWEADGYPTGSLSRWSLERY